MALTVPWTRRHLLGLEELSRQEIVTILDSAETFAELSQRQRKKRTHLTGKWSSTCSSSLPRARGPASAWQRGGSARTFRLHPVKLQPQQGGDVHRHGQEHRGDGIDLIVVRHASSGAPSARTAPSVRHHQRRRRRSRTSHAGLARYFHHPPDQEAPGGADRRSRRRHRP